MTILRGAVGLIVLMSVAWLMSSHKRRFPLKIVIGGLALQFALALLVLRTEWGRTAFDTVGRGVTAILHGADAGATFVFGPLAGSHPDVKWSAIAGIKIMSTIVVFSMLSAIGYHLGILQRVVGVLAFVMSRLLGVSGAESLSGAANVFLGQTEAPMLVRPYLSGMTRSELMAVMTGGFTTIALGVMGVYVDMLGIDATGARDPERAVAVARHLLTASLMCAPAAFIMAKIMLPETEVPATAGHVQLDAGRDAHNVLDAATEGASQGMTLAINVLAMLIAFVALVAIVDLGLGALGRIELFAALLDSIGVHELTLGTIFGWVFAPVAYLIGIEPADRQAVGSLLGMAMATNEMVAYGTLSEMIQNNSVSERSVRLATYALCGFANIGSMGIQIAGIGIMAPDRRRDLASLAPRAMLGGAMATWMSACIAGILS